MMKSNAGNDEATLPPESLSLGRPGGWTAEQSALVVVWSREEPARIGEVLLVPPGTFDAPWIFGRGGAASSERRLLLCRQRPGKNQSTGALECPRISRTQLHLLAGADGTISVENVGRCPLLRNGEQITSSLVRPGDLLELQNELLLLCTQRPHEIAPLPPDYAFAEHPFGEPDALGLLGETPSMWEVRRQIASLARISAHVLIQGPSGSGKELAARAIHTLSARGARPWVSRNAATIPETLLDAELFGNLRNYPNPGTPERPGLIGQADRSTLFLDEFAEISANLQAHLLRVLDGGEYQRLGEATARKSDFRFIAATNRPESALKHDVLARLSARLVMPGLSARPEDIPLFVTHLVRHRAEKDPSIAGKFFQDGQAHGHPRVSPMLIEALVRHPYRTHVRELEALLLAAIMTSPGKYLEKTEALERALRQTAPEPGPEPVLSTDAFTEEEWRRLQLQRLHGFRATECGRDPAYPGNRQTADLHLRQFMCKVLALAEWDVDRAASLLAGSEDENLLSRAQARMNTFLRNLERKLEAGMDELELRKSLAEEWRGATEGVFRVLLALRDDKIRRRGGASCDVSPD